MCIKEIYKLNLMWRVDFRFKPYLLLPPKIYITSKWLKVTHTYNHLTSFTKAWSKSLIPTVVKKPSTLKSLTRCRRASEQWERMWPWVGQGRQRHIPSTDQSSGRPEPDEEGGQFWANQSELSSANKQTIKTNWKSQTNYAIWIITVETVQCDH